MQHSHYRGLAGWTDPTCGGRGNGWTGRASFVPEQLAVPLHWRNPRRVAVSLMGDLFHEDIAFTEIAAVYGVMAATPHLTYLILTKRPQLMVEFYRWVETERANFHGATPSDFCELMAQTPLKQIVESGRDEWPLPNVWVGVSAEDQETLDARWPLLAQVTAAVSWVSLEPLLAPVTLKCNGCGEDVQSHLSPDQGGCSGWFPDWVVVGCESGPGRRPCKREWVESIVRQCRDAGVPVHVKQVALGSDGCDLACCKHRVSRDPREWPPDLRVREWPKGKP